MSVAQFNKTSYVVMVVFMLLGVTIFFPFIYEGSLKDMVIALAKVEGIGMLLFLFGGLLSLSIIKLEVSEDERLIYTDLDFNWRKTAKIENVLEIYRTPRLKPFDTIFEGLTVVYKDSQDQIKSIEINLNLFKSEDIVGILKELTAINPNIRFDDYCESLVSGKYFKKEREQLQKRREKIKREFNLRRLSRVAGITMLVGIGLIILFVVYILYFSGSN